MAEVRSGSLFSLALYDGGDRPVLFVWIDHRLQSRGIFES